MNSPTEIQNSATVSFYVGQAPSAPAKIEITSADGTRTFTADIPVVQGINRYFWPLSFATPGGGGGGAGRGGRAGGGRAGGAPPADAGVARGGGAAAAAAAADPDAPPPMAPQAARGGGGGGRGGGAAATAGPGTYRVKLTIGDQVINSTIVVRADPGAGRVTM
jgi:hypothetical protein